MLKKSVLFFATGLGLGYSPFASGTVGTLLALPLVWFFWELKGMGWIGQIAVASVLAILAVPVCELAERHFDTKDDGKIVADEFLTFPICMIALPWNPWVVVMAFLTCRFFDIVKPPPANQLQKLKGGLGIVIDDVIAALYSLGVNHAVVWLTYRLLA